MLYVTRAGLLALLSLALTAVPSSAQSYFWTGGASGAGASGNWNSTLWTLQGSPNQPNVGPPPGAADATIQIGNTPFTVTVSDTETIHNLTVNNGTNATLQIAAGGSLTVNGAFALNGTLDNTGNGLNLNGVFNWNGGSIVAGTVTANHGGSFAGGTADVRLAGGNLSLGGTNQSWSWTGGQITLSGGAAFTIGSGVTVTKTGSLNLFIQRDTTGVTGTESFVNNGTLVWAGDANTTLTLNTNLPVTNAGTIRVTSGVISILSVTGTTGTFDTGNSVLGTGTISLDGGGTTAFNAGSSIVGTGTFRLGSGSTQIVTLNAAVPASTLTLLGGTVQGTGSFAVSGPFQLQGGTIAGSATVTATGGGTISTTNSTISTGTVNLNAPAAGTATYTWPDHNVTFTGTGSLTVGLGATLQATSNNSILATAGNPTVTITGMLQKSGGTGATTIGGSGLTLTNTGTIDAETGVISLTGTTNNAGGLTANGTGIISTDTGGTLNLNTGSTGTGNGTLRVNAGTAVLNVNVDTTTATGFDIAAGNVQGTKTLTVNGPFTWAGGTVGGSATVKATAGGTVAGTSTVGTGTVNLAGGTFSWTTGDLAFAGTGSLLVSAGATLSSNGNHNFAYTSGTPTVQNNGTIEKTGGAGAAQIQTGLTFNNAGTLRVTNGSWTLFGTLNNTGTLDIGVVGTEIYVNGGTLNLNAGSSATGSGLFRVDNATSVLTVNAAVTSNPGLTYIRGTINGTGNLSLGGAFNFGLFSGSLAGSVTINAGGGGDWTSTGTPLISTGSVNLTGGTVTWNTSDITFSGSGALTIGSGATLNLIGDRSISITSGTPTVTVNGTLTKSAGTGTSTINSGITFTVGGTGLVDVESGTLRPHTNAAINGTIKAGGAGTLLFDLVVTLSGTGTLNVASGGTLTSAPGAAGTITVPTGMTLTNSGTVQATSGTFAVNGSATLSNYTAGTQTLAGGVWLATGATIDFGGRAIGTIASGTTVELSGATAAVTGLNSITQVNGQLRIYNGATLTPPATVNIAGVVEASGTLGTAVVVQNGGKLTGNGMVNGSVSAQSGGTVTPGPGPYAASGPGVLTVGNTALNGASTYVWELNSWTSTPTAGTNFDQLKGLSGAKMNLAGASSASPVVLKITSLNGTSPGQIPAFDATQARSWVVADFSAGNATGGVQSFTPDRFTLDTSAFLNSLGTTSFSLSLDANSNLLVLSFMPVPEPGSAGLAVFVVGAGLAGIRRGRRVRRRFDNSYSPRRSQQMFVSVK
jgi:hypothetical protein